MEKHGKPAYPDLKIAEEEKNPKKFLEQDTFGSSETQVFCTVKKGALGGGYSLNKDPKEIFLKCNIMRITDGPIAMVPCASLNFYHKCGRVQI